MNSEKIIYINRLSGATEQEVIFGEKLLRWLYGKPSNMKCMNFLARNPIFSHLYGWWNKRVWTKASIRKFILDYNVDIQDFAKDVEDFDSFNDFFTRALKDGVRDIDSDNRTCIIPADARYKVYQNISSLESIMVKSIPFSIEKLLGSKQLADKYKCGSLVVARLAPMDYHRFHFPCNAICSKPMLINGLLHSVNPITMTTFMGAFCENKRYITALQSDVFGSVLFIEVGAMNVGSIIHTSGEGYIVNKGDEKGYFSFGGSAVLLFFEHDRIVFEKDLVANTAKGFETLCKFGQRLGSAVLK